MSFFKHTSKLLTSISNRSMSAKASVSGVQIASTTNAQSVEGNSYLLVPLYYTFSPLDFDFNNYRSIIILTVSIVICAGFYSPPSSLDMQYFKPSAAGTSSVCGWKVSRL